MSGKPRKRWPEDYIPDGQESNGLRCPKCNCPRTRVLKKRPAGSVDRRSRECEHCGERFTTYERII